jgi:hypothetical protein
MSSLTCIFCLRDMEEDIRRTIKASATDGGKESAGMVSWWETRTDLRTVVRFGLVCFRDFCRTERAEVKDLFLLDRHVELATGKRAFPTMAQIFYNYEQWSPEARKKALDTFWELDRLPNAVGEWKTSAARLDAHGL